MADQQESVPEHCPGPQSDNAGKSSACEGCPSRQQCASGEAKKPSAELPMIKERLQDIKHKILVLSGKGGVGKSTFSSQLALTLSSIKEYDTGIMDIDICGPSIPTILGVKGDTIHTTVSGWEPVYKDNLAIISIGFLLSDNEAVIWRGPKKNGLIMQFLRDVNWGEQEYLIVDTPPGTSDEHLSIVEYLKHTGITGAVIVTTPQEVSLLDVRKEINFCKKVGIPILGVVENMSTFVCPKCKTETKIFPPTTGGAVTMCKEMDVPFLGSIPLDPMIARSCDQGQSYIENNPNSLASQAYKDIVEKIIEKCNNENKE